MWLLKRLLREVLSFDCSIKDQNSVVNLANMAVKKIMEKNGTLYPKITEEEKQCI